MSKYNACKTVINGIVFDSKAEGEYYSFLLEKERKGTIDNFITQPRYILQEAFEKNGKKFRKIEYVADFEISHLSGEIEVVDVKGFVTETAKLKFKLFEKKYPYKLSLIKYVKKFGGWVTLSEYARLKKEEKKK